MITQEANELRQLIGDIKSIKKTLKSWTTVFTQIMELQVQNSKQQNHNSILLNKIIQSLKPNSISPIRQKNYTEPDDFQKHIYEGNLQHELNNPKQISIVNYQGTPFDSAYLSINRELQQIDEPKQIKNTDSRNYIHSTKQLPENKENFKFDMHKLKIKEQKYIEDPHKIREQVVQSCQNKMAICFDFQKTPSNKNYFMENSRSCSKPLQNNNPNKPIKYEQTRAKSFSDQNKRLSKKCLDLELIQYDNSQEILRKINTMRKT